MPKRVFLIILDSFGIGHAPDAASFGDEGSNTWKSVASCAEFDVPNMKRLGLFHIDGMDCGVEAAQPLGIFGRLQEASQGKDTTIGHWEIAGLVMDKPLPIYPQGFPQTLIDAFSKATGRGVLCNQPYSGTDVIRDFGKQHCATGDLIVYTSADSVFQIAAHEDIVPLDTLYHYCTLARSCLVGEHGVGRVIARPFAGQHPYQRTSGRHDYSLKPPHPTMLDALRRAGLTTLGIGKISDIFAGQGIERSQRIQNNEDGMVRAISALKEDFTGLCFVNLVDFDMLYGHRRDKSGYAKALCAFDKQLGLFLQEMQEDDVLMITADHGCDPGFPGTDHTRECVPFLAYGRQLDSGVNLGTRRSFADIAATILELFNVEGTTDGASFAAQLQQQVQ